MKLERQLEELKEKIEDVKAQKIQLTTEINGLLVDKKDLLDQCTKLGVDPKNIDAESKRLEDELTKEMVEIKKDLDTINV